MIFSFLFFFGLDFLAGVTDVGREWFRLGAGGETLTGRRRPGPELLVLELLLVWGVVWIVVGGPEACLRLLLPWGGGGGVTKVEAGVIGLDFSTTWLDGLDVVVESADVTVTLAAISFCNTLHVYK